MPIVHSLLLSRWVVLWKRVFLLAVKRKRTDSVRWISILFHMWGDKNDKIYLRNSITMKAFVEYRIFMTYIQITFRMTRKRCTITVSYLHFVPIEEICSNRSITLLSYLVSTSQEISFALECVAIIRHHIFQHILYVIIKKTTKKHWQFEPNDMPSEAISHQDFVMDLCLIFQKRELAVPYILKSLKQFLHAGSMIPRCHTNPHPKKGIQAKHNDWCKSIQKNN